MPKTSTRQTDMFPSKIWIDTETMDLNQKAFIKITKPTVPVRIASFLSRKSKSYPKHQQRLVRSIQAAQRRKHRVLCLTQPIMRRVFTDAIRNELVVTLPMPASYQFNTAYDLVSVLGVRPQTPKEP